MDIVSFFIERNHEKYGMDCENDSLNCKNSHKPIYDIWFIMTKYYVYYDMTLYIIYTILGKTRKNILSVFMYS